MPLAGVDKETLILGVSLLTSLQPYGYSSAILDLHAKPDGFGVVTDHWSDLQMEHSFTTTLKRMRGTSCYMQRGRDFMAFFWRVEIFGFKTCLRGMCALFATPCPSWPRDQDNRK
ncbi:hypothetical protein FOZ63_016997 [Perkinsus olseni]|uniref:Uncharacterized protein n=1 Tax=Perkinsus olseni TaxID=32597 RepID=A0A7J6TMD8_PEROL|nr:hypothetical protein FOZ62_018596 [Perkinsus olseni]KAF4746433.1 hypothetical protein FOZ63_016997 [Perkinsus olseni]